MSPTKGLGTLTDPAPVQRGATLSSYEEESKESKLTIERISRLERRVDTRLSNTENQLVQLYSRLTQPMMQNSSSQQLYSKSLASALQKDIGSVKDLVKSKQSDSGGLIQSSVDFDKAICGVTNTL